MSYKKIALVIGTALCSAAQSKDVTYYYTDPQGTVLAETDAQGSILAATDFSPFGRPAIRSGMDDVYAGHLTENETGLVYMKARYYDPVVGRFVSRDPVPTHAGDVISTNAFAYVGNNPLSRTDPSGQYECKGASDKCDVVAKAVADINKAAGGLAEGSHDRKALESIAKFYGAPGEKNGVSVTIGNIGKAVANTSSDRRLGTTDIKINMEKFAMLVDKHTQASKEAELSGLLAHEGRHGQTGPRYERDLEYADEQAAYRIQGAVNQGLNVNSLYGLWRSDSGINQSAIDMNAKASTEIWCSTGGNCR